MKDVMNDLSLDLKKKMYAEMLRIRMAEEKLIEIWPSGQIHSPIHLSIGQEAVAVGVCNALNNNDLVFSNHRCHAHYLAKGGSLREMYAELAGETNSALQGKSGSMHLHDLKAGFFLAVPLVAGSIPIAVGTGLSAKIKNINRVSVAFFGDGAVEEGVFWESLNFASVHKLPVIFVCENNLYATHAHILKRQPNADIASRMTPHGVYSVTVDGNNVKQVYLESKKMVRLALSGKGPSFMEARTYRWLEHWGTGDDWHLGYRTEEEGNLWKERCPIKRLRNEILATGLEDIYFETVIKAIRKEIEEVYQW